MTTLIRHSIPTQAKGGVYAVGNFDGLHQGHLAVLNITQSIAQALRVTFGVVTFEPHPKSVSQPKRTYFRLTPFRSKWYKFVSLGVEWVIIRRFNQALQQTSPEQFLEDILWGQIGAVHLVVGYNFRFGYKRRGNFELLKNFTERKKIGVTWVGQVTDKDGVIYSSSAIRSALTAGDPRLACHLLGEPWCLVGRVVKGEQRGRYIGFPTANIQLGLALRPAFGVYAVYVGIEEKSGLLWYKGVANIGLRPTLGGKVERLEVHLLNFAGNLYGKIIRVQLIEYLRTEHKLESLSILQEHIRQDALQAQQLLSLGTPKRTGKETFEYI